MDTINLDKYALHKPGNWIAGKNRDLASQARNLLSMIEDKYITAVVAFSKFKPSTFHGNKNVVLDKYGRVLNRIYADSFVLSLDMINKLIWILSKYINAPKTVCDIVTKNKHDFKIINNIRDSIAHLEDRGRGKKKKGESISASIIVLSSFLNDRYGFTGEDGKQYYVEITEPTVERIRGMVQEIINAYKWE